MSGRHSSVQPARPAAATLPAVTRSGRAGRSHAAEGVLHRLAHHRTGLRRTAGGFAAMAVVGATLSFTAGAGEAVGTPAQATAPAFAGYSTTSTGSPLKIEVYEPTIPLPAEPQLELSVGYSAVAADSASSRARSSYLWPGAPVGEGFKTIADQLGLPPEIGAAGYPIQVNATFPGDQTEESDEPAPGMIQRASAGDDKARADNGLSTDGETKNDDGGSGSGDGDGDGGSVPGLPSLPGLPGLSAGLDSVLGGTTPSGRSATTGTTTGGRTGTKAATAAPLLPAPLAALVDVGGFSSTSRTDATKTADSYGRAQAADITLLGGVITIEGVKTVSTASSDGTKGTALGRADYGDIVVAGQRFRFGSDGYEAAGQSGAAPDLPAQAVALLEELGVTIKTPKPIYTKDGDAASVTTPGLAVELDLKKLRSRDGGLADALNDALAQLPEQLDQVKSPLQAAIYAAPRIVLYLGTSSASTDTSAAIPPPDTTTPTDDQSDDTTSTGTGDTGAGTGDTGAGTAPAQDPPTDPTVPAEEAAAAGESEAVAPVSADSVPPGLPPVLSFPGLLLYGGLIGAGVAGFFVRRLGALALGAGASCPHGLASGLPDLRKVT